MAPKKILCSLICLMVGLLWFTMATVELADARAGGGRSSGSRGSRSFSPPTQTFSSPSTSRPTTSTPPSTSTSRPATQPGMGTPAPQPQSGGFMRGLAGGLAGGLIGGMIGNMLFGGSGHAAGVSAGGGGCSSIGLFDILLIAGLVYLGYRLLNRRREDGDRYVSQDPTQSSNIPGSWQEPPPVTAAEQYPPAVDLRGIQNYDRDFNEAAFKEKAQDIFFKLQSAWMRQDLSTIRDLVADDLYNSLSRDLEALKAKGQVNRLENIAIRQVEISEVWQEEGNDFITVGFLANLLDYVVDSKTSQVVGGSDKEPVKFEEYWTFVRPMGPGPWKLTAIQQP